jgi:hypothetical protein
MARFGRKQKAAPAVIDLREPAASPLEFGFPTPCPVCRSHGYLDSIDVTQRVMYQHCPTCWTKWTTSEAELAPTT